MRINKILSSLNKNQLEAVKMPRVPVLMLAGPGTGKTRTLIARILFQIEHYKIPAENVLALTFSNKASKEMGFRLEKVLQDKAHLVYTSTIHSFCLDILRKYHQQANLDPYFSVCDQNYQMNLLKNLISDKALNGSDGMVNGVRSAIEHYLMRDKPLPPFSAMVYDQYSAYLEKHRLVDFNQILVKTKDLLVTYPDICDQYAFMYQAIHVDEFQDTDIIQYQIIKMLAQKHKNIFVVADDDQSIYTWRGANPENIQNFIKDFNIENPLNLQINYRSGQNIIDAAHAIVKSVERIEPDKILKASEIINDSIDVQFFDNENQEINFIIEKINHWIHGKETPLAEIAVLYPQHRFSEKLALKMISEKIHFQQASGHNFSDDPQMKKVLLYLQLIRDPMDVLILQELVEKELGYNVHKQIQNLQNVRKAGYRKALYELIKRSETNDELKRQLEMFVGNLANLINLKTFYSFDQLLHQIINGFQEFDKNYIEDKARHFSDFDSPGLPDLFKNNKKIWIYHQDEQLAMLAQQMFKILKKESVILNDANHKLANKNDITFILSPCPYAFKSKIYEVFNLVNEKRESSFSALLRIIQDNLTGQKNVFTNYVVFDLETTGKDTDNCGIVEIAAVKIRNKEIVDSFQTLVNPQKVIEKQAFEVHHISDDDVLGQPTIDEIWKSFIKFIGTDILIAHNGYAFDFPIIDRYSQQIEGQKLKNVRYDSLVFARQLYPMERNSIDALSEKFGLDPGIRHRALDDVKVLHAIFQQLLMEFNTRHKKISADFLFEYVALANYLKNNLSAYEDRVFFFAGLQKLVSPFSEIVPAYCEKFNLNKDKLINDISRQAYELNPDITFFNHKDDFKIKLFKLAAEFSSLEIDKAISTFLSVVMLLNPQDNLSALNAVSLLTFHSAKGLEFKKVFIMGMEDQNMPSFHAYQEDDLDDRTIDKKMDEQKRLLYVGLTRAKEEIILTAVKNRMGRLQKSSPFLREILNFMRKNM